MRVSPVNTVSMLIFFWLTGILCFESVLNSKIAGVSEGPVSCPIIPQKKLQQARPHLNGNGVELFKKNNICGITTGKA